MNIAVAVGEKPSLAGGADARRLLLKCVEGRAREIRPAVGEEIGQTPEEFAKLHAQKVNVRLVAEGAVIGAHDRVHPAVEQVLAMRRQLSGYTLHFVFS
jgi:hypothetical protein